MVVLVVVVVWGVASVAASLAMCAVVACADRSTGPSRDGVGELAPPAVLQALPAAPAHRRLTGVV